MKLIDADALLDKFEWKEDGPLYIRSIRAMIEVAPTIDAVPVVRCKDCKYWNPHIKECEGIFGFDKGEEE